MAAHEPQALTPAAEEADPAARTRAASGGTRRRHGARHDTQDDIRHDIQYDIQDEERRR
ncbi:hypothetical protein [Streptomyces glaucosporus]|uniref:hypothetical protein n=1 Tax=Streptomyces glaucosporus TaxID=284044 RepID=UPI0031E3C22C